MQSVEAKGAMNPDWQTGSNQNLIEQRLAWLFRGRTSSMVFLLFYNTQRNFKRQPLSLTFLDEKRRTKVRL